MNRDQVYDHMTSGRIKHLGPKKNARRIRKLATKRNLKLWKVTNLIIQHDRVQQQFSSSWSLMQCGGEKYNIKHRYHIRYVVVRGKPLKTCDKGPRTLCLS